MQKGDIILDGNLMPVQVVTLGKSFLGGRTLHQLNANGPVFTGEHQFISNLTTMQVGVLSKEDLLNEHPQLQGQAKSSGLFSTINNKHVPFN